MLLKSLGQFVGLANDLLCRSGHHPHLKYLGRASIACTFTGPSVASTTPISSNLPAIRSDEHQEPFVDSFDADGVVVRMKDVVVADAVFAGAPGDERIALHAYKLACLVPRRKLPCSMRAPSNGRGGARYSPLLLMS